MITNKVSDLYRRSKQLADLEGSNYISWNEVINCINESYIGLYEKLINMGDNSFVASFRMSNGVEKLPEDFWQLKGVFLWNDGNLKTINRRADNTSIHYVSYELRNGEIIINGNADDVLVEYYTKPKTLLMPPSDTEVSLNLPEGVVILDCHAHTFLYVTQDEEENDILCIYDLDGIKSATDILTAWENDFTYIVDNYVFSITSDGLAVYNIASGVSTLLPPGTSPLITEGGDLLFVADGDITDIEGKVIKEFTPATDAILFVADNDLNDFYSLVEDNSDNVTVYHNDTDTEQKARRIIYADNKCYFLSAGNFGVIEDDAGKYIKSNIGSSIGFVGINKNTGYGYATKKYNKVWVCAYCEDTVLDFPNSFYFQILSYLLAISFRCKQGADVSLLSSQLAMVEQTFEDTLGSDNFQFPRMNNVYN